jgi:undecaprenyl-diphosphatase
MTIPDAIILGLVEGITEYLPVSSTGHLIIVSALLGLNKPPDVKQAADAFTIIIQGGAILAVLGLYWSRVTQMVRGLLGRDPAGRRLAINIVVAFLPAAVLGPLLADTIQDKLFYPGPVMAALFIGGIIMLLLKKWQRAFFHDSDQTPAKARAFVSIENMTWRRALIIGLLQCIAMWPGTSRSMMTIVGGMLVGMRPKHAAEFSFLLGLPTLGGACVYKLGKNLMSDDPSVFEVLGGPLPVIIGIVVAMISAALAVKWLVGYLSRHGVALFGWYRIGLCIVIGVLVWQGLIDITPD